MSVLYQIFSFVPAIKYPLIILGTIIEGPLVMMLSGVFVRLNVVDLVPVYFALMLGDLIGDTIWYCVGFFWGTPFIARFGKYFSISEKMVATIEHFFQRYHDKILIISKLTTGFGFAPVVLFTAGLTKISFRRYFLLNLIGQFFWTAILISIGFFFTNLYESVNNVLGRIGISALIIVLIAVLFGVGKYIRSRITAPHQQN